MNEIPEANPSEQAQEPKPEKLCDYLRRMREAKRITIEKVARDTKLNLDYLFALERGDYTNIPAEAYVRIYLRSVAKYLELDPADVLKRYDQEHTPKEPEEEKRPTRTRSTLSRPAKLKPLILLVVVVVLVAVFSFLRSGRLQIERKSIPAATGSTARPNRERPLVPYDTLELDTATVPEQEDLVEPVLDIPPREESVVSKPVEQPIRLTIRCDRDSSWVMVLSDRQNTWRNMVRFGEIRSFQAREIFHVSLGRAEAVSVFVNRKKVNLIDTDVVRFSVANSGIHWFDLRSWNKSLQGTDVR